MEHLRFNYLIELSKEFLVETEPKSQHYLKNVTDSYLNWLAGSLDLILSNNEKGGIVRIDDEKIRKLIVSHEYGHLYEFLK